MKEGVTYMEVFFLVLLKVIFPVFIIVMLGFFLQRKFQFDLNTFSKVTTYVLMPAVAFVNVYKSEISGELVLEVLLFLFMQSAALILFSECISKAAKYDRSFAATFKNTIVLNNSGNFGLPVSQLVFSNNPLGLSIQVIVLIFQNLLTFTYGLFNSVSTEKKSFAAIFEVLKLPILYAFFIGLMLNFLNVSLPDIVLGPILNLSNAFLAIALITLGAQVAFLKVSRITLHLALSVAGRLVLSPILAFCIILLLGMEGTTAQALFIASSFPSSRNSALFALEYNNYPEYAAQVVLISTILSSFTVAIVIYLSGVLF